MKITLDAGAVRALIEHDPEMGVELRRCVVAEIVKNTLLKDANGIIEEINPKAMARMLQEMGLVKEIEVQFEKAVNSMVSGGWGRPVRQTKLTTKTKERLDVAMETNIHEFTTELAQQRDAALKEYKEDMLDNLGTRLEEYMDRCVKYYFEKDVATAVRERIDAISKELGT